MRHTAISSSMIVVSQSRSLPSQPVISSFAFLKNAKKGSKRCLLEGKSKYSGANRYITSCIDLAVASGRNIKSVDPQSFINGDSDMVNESAIHLTANTLSIRGRPVLRGVPDNVVFTPDLGPEGIYGAFLGARSEEPGCCHNFSLGKLEGLRFLSCFRFKLWWMTQRIGSKGSEVPTETQFLLLESRDSSTPQGPAYGGNTDVTYVVLLPLLDHSFRASFYGGSNDNLYLSVESGDPSVKATEFYHSIYVHCGPDPYKVTTEAVRAVEDHSKSFMRRERKQMPGMLDYFGWCTWDAFYTDVSVDGVHQGLASLAAGGTPARFLIIDDGWQSVAMDDTVGEDVNLTAGTQYASRLMQVQENAKFKQRANSQPGDSLVDLGHVVQEMKAHHGLKYVYVWHALMGYWGGVSVGDASSQGMRAFEPSLVYPVHSASVLEQQPDMAQDSLTVHGLGVVPPDQIAAFYCHLHGYLAAMGVDGVKVDVQAILETLGAGYGGRVQLAKSYHQALEASIRQHFPDNGIIACMSHNTDGLYSAKQTAVVRASDDFWPQDPASHSTHIASVAYNSLFLGEFMQPDWDMFHSLHPAAEYHGAARAIGGCAVYVSDKPGEHDFSLLKKLVLPDGSVLRAQLPGRPCRDSLFIDPARDNSSLLKVWNLNEFGGVVGAFNCQGAGWCTVDKKYAIHNESPPTVSGAVRAMDVDSLLSKAPPGWTLEEGEAAVYSHRAGELVRVKPAEPLPVALGPLQYEVFTVVPITEVSSAVAVAPIGLVDMFNSGGAVVSFKASLEGSRVVARSGVRGCGRFAAYCSARPEECQVDGVEAAVSFDETRGLLVVHLEHKAGHVWNVKMAFA